MSDFKHDALNPGEHFFYNGIEFICLDILEDGNIFAMTANPYDEIPFDTDNCNDWRKSSLRRVLNNDFLDLLDRKHLVKQTSDLIADNGDKAYGTCKDYVTILSCDQYRKYRDIVPLFEEWMWTLTPWSCNAGVADGVRRVTTTGYVSGSNAYNSYGVAPACVFSSKNLKLCRDYGIVEACYDE